MKVKLSMVDGVWVVTFGKKENLTLHTFSYKKAFFWKKYSDEIDKDFILDYIHGR